MVEHLFALDAVIAQKSLNNSFKTLLHDLNMWGENYY